MSCCKVSSKIKILKFGTRNALFRYFGLQFWIKTELYLKSVPSNLSYCKVWCKTKKHLNLWPKILYLYIFGLEFEKNILIFEISTLKFVSIQILVQKKKKKKNSLNLGSTFPHLGILNLEFEDNSVISEIRSLQFV